LAATDGGPEHVFTASATQAAKPCAAAETIGFYRLVPSEANRFSRLATAYPESVELRPACDPRRLATADPITYDQACAQGRGQRVVMRMAR
jgi:hypothetical protein